MRAAILAAVVSMWMAGAAVAQPSIVAAENFYGDVAGQIGGAGVRVTSILSRPDQDPHLFEASPSTARAVQAAQIVVYNGADYDPWMAKLVAATAVPGRTVLVAADLAHRRAGENPHLWYDPAVMPVVASALADALAAADPAQAAAYRQRLAAFRQSLEPLARKIADMRARHAGVAITATEPVFGYLAAALGLEMRNERFQLAVMNDTEPRASDVAAFEADLRTKRVRALLFNSQATGPVVQRMLRLAKASGVPVVGVTETEPAGMSFQAWMMGQLEALDTALAAAR